MPTQKYCLPNLACDDFGGGPHPHIAAESRIAVFSDALPLSASPFAFVLQEAAALSDREILHARSSERRPRPRGSGLVADADGRRRLFGAAPAQRH